MANESLEELRDRLLRQHGVQEMIQVRAYEIFQMRGCQPGGEAQDWFHAEGEVLAFLIARESTREDENAKPHTDSVFTSEVQPTPARTKKPKLRAAARPVSAKQTVQTKKSSRRSATKKPPASKSKSKRTSAQSKTEDGNR